MPHTHRALIVLVLLALALPASAQVMRTQVGRQLDSNYRIGSSGFNSVRSVDPSGWLSTQMYITGQVTGGFSFRGGVPYAAGNQLRLTLPTETIENFNRDSAGLDRVLTGGNYAAQPYFGRSNTVAGLPAIRQSLNAPGSTIPRISTGSVPVLGDQIYVSPGTEYAPIAAGSLSGLLRVEPVIRETPLLTLAPTEGLVPERPRYSTLFGVVRGEDRQRLELEIARRELPNGTEMDPRPGQQVQPGEPRPSDEQVQPGLPRPVRQIVPEGQPSQAVDVADPAPPGQRAPRELRPGQRAPGAPPAIEPLSPEDVTPGEAQRGGVVQPGLAPGQDVYNDLSRELDALRESRMRRQLSPLADPNALPGQAGGEPDAFDAGRRQSAQARTQVQRLNEAIRLHGLTGRRPNLVNRYMQLGEQALRGGQFYEAASLFETARVADRDNPLPAVGAMMAYLGAGEPVTAGYYLDVALRLMPELREVRLDLPRFVGPDVLQERLKTVTERINEADTPPVNLVLLATYLNLSLDETDRARTHAYALKSLAEKGSHVEAFADYVLTEAK